MTPPDWLLQGLGGAAAVTLCLLVSVLWPFRSASGRVRLTPAHKARLKQQQQRRAAHELEVLRPGLIHAAFDRDFIGRSDMETHGWGWHLMIFEHDLPLSAVLDTHVRASLPASQDARASWLIQMHEQLEEPTKHPGGSIAREGRQRVTDVAIMALAGDAPRLLCPDFPISRVGSRVLYAHYHSQQDPDVLYQTRQQHLNPRVEMTRRSYSYDPAAVDSVRRTMVRCSPAPSD